MQIANPIYDVVFKYLVSDSKIAKLLLSMIIGEEIVELAMAPQESVVELERHSLTVFRIDFGATIRTESGLKKVIIEIQKAKFASDIMRFRKYLGLQYQDGNNVYLDGQGRKQALPILTIYFLGYALERIEAAVIRVKRLYEDGATSTPIEERNDFIESLSHDSYVIQIPHLKQKRRSELEQILSIFDQSKVTGGGHFLAIDEAAYPKKYLAVIRRLQRAVAEPQLKLTMEIEDEILEDLQDKERLLETKDRAIEEHKKALEEKGKVIEENRQALEENKKALEEKSKVIEENRQALEEKDKTLEEKDKALAEKERLIAELTKRLG